MEPDSPVALADGTLTRWLGDRGFGWIRLSGESFASVFVHRDAFPLASFPRVGQRLRFELVQSGRGPRAEHVQLVD